MAAGKLGSVNISTPATNTLVYTVPSNTVSSLNIRICNRNASEVKIRVAIGTGVAPALEDYIDYDIPVAANTIMEDSGIVCSADENIWVYSDVAGVSVRVHGFEEGV